MIKKTNSGVDNKFTVLVLSGKSSGFVRYSSVISSWLSNAFCCIDQSSCQVDTRRYQLFLNDTELMLTEWTDDLDNKSWMNDTQLSSKFFKILD